VSATGTAEGGYRICERTGYAAILSANKSMPRFFPAPNTGWLSFLGVSEATQSIYLMLSVKQMIFILTWLCVE
jgi:hypothetical protein